MMFATKIRMQPYCDFSNDPTEIAEIYIIGCPKPGYYAKAVLYDYLMKYPGSICVGTAPFPVLIPERSLRGEKYVRSTPNVTTNDNLLSLPREYSW